MSTLGSRTFKKSASAIPSVKISQTDSPTEMGNRVFKTGDVCEVITKKNAQPKRDWLEFARTANARSRIKRYLRTHGEEI